MCESHEGYCELEKQHHFQEYESEREKGHHIHRRRSFSLFPSRIFFAALIVSGGREQREKSGKGDEVVSAFEGERREVKAINAGKNSHKTRRGMMARMATGGSARWGK